MKSAKIFESFYVLVGALAIPIIDYQGQNKREGHHFNDKNCFNLRFITIVHKILRCFRHQLRFVVILFCNNIKFLYLSAIMIVIIQLQLQLCS